MRVLEDFGQFGLDSGDAHWLQNDKDLVNLARTKVMFEQVFEEFSQIFGDRSFLVWQIPRGNPDRRS